MHILKRLLAAIRLTEALPSPALFCQRVEAIDQYRSDRANTQDDRIFVGGPRRLHRLPRAAPGVMPITLLNVRLKAASDV